MGKPRRALGWFAGLAAVTVAAPGAAESEARWLWSRDSDQVHSVDVEFVRGSAVIVRRAGPVHVEVTKRSVQGQQHQVAIDIDDQLGRIRIRDRYAARVGWQWSDCHPVTPRGNFWDSDVRLHITIHAPEGVDLAVRFLDGELRR